MGISLSTSTQKPIEVSDGRYILPIYGKMYSMPENQRETQMRSRLANSIRRKMTRQFKAIICISLLFLLCSIAFIIMAVLLPDNKNSQTLLALGSSFLTLVVGFWIPNPNQQQEKNGTNALSLQDITNSNPSSNPPDPVPEHFSGTINEATLPNLTQGNVFDMDSVQEITSELFSRFTVEQTAGLNNSAVEKLTEDQLKNLKVTALNPGRIPHLAIEKLSKPQMESLTKEQLKKITKKQIEKLKPDRFNDIQYSCLTSNNKSVIIGKLLRALQE